MAEVRNRDRSNVAADLFLPMTAPFSYTAPEFTEKDLEKVRNLLTDEERHQIDSERNGTCAILRESASMIANAEASVDISLHRIDDLSKAAYLEAVQRCPDLVRSESDFLRFLRAENFDPVVKAQQPAAPSNDCPRLFWLFWQCAPLHNAQLAHATHIVAPKILRLQPLAW